jgi:hypothetical protein
VLGFVQQIEHALALECAQGVGGRGTRGPRRVVTRHFAASIVCGAREAE